MEQKNANVLWYDSPADGWLGAMPLGNGKLGAMVYGGTTRETIQFNEDSVWTRAQEDMDNPDALKYLPQVRELLLEGKVLEAQELASIGMFAIPNEQPAYQVLGELRLINMGQFVYNKIKNYPEHINDYEGEANRKAIGEYHRALDMQSAVAEVGYSYDTQAFQREFFISEETNTFVAKYTTDRKAGISLYAQIFREFDALERPCGDDTLMLDGRAGAFGSQFYMEIKFCPVGGTVERVGQHIMVKDADELYIYASSATDFRHADYKEVVKANIQQAIDTGYEELKAQHVACHRELYDRASLSVQGETGNGKNQEKPMDARVADLRSGATETDFDFIGQYFNFVRYQMITSSRAGSQPTNLQGIWCNDIWPSWECKHTTNINFEMNYWPAEVANLAECHTAMFDHIDKVVENGKKTAKTHYGCRGFALHSNTDLWADTAPVDNVYCGLWPSCGGWLALHLWQAYRYSMDQDFLTKRAYPVLKEATLFFVDFLIKDGQGRYVFGPSISPENSYYEKNGYRVGLCMGATMDHSIIRCTFDAYKQAAVLLGCDQDLVAEVDERLASLHGLQIAQDGTLMEWMEDYQQMFPGHRHLSHLFCMFPGEEVTLEGTPELAAACQKSLEKRAKYGSGASGWSGAWAANIWCKLKQGDKAFDILQNIFKVNTSANLFDLHPPLPPGNDKYVFQIDGNFGALTALCHLMLQSTAQEVSVLPCLPTSWKNGSVKGLRACGGYTVDIDWADGKIVSTTITASVDDTLTLKSCDKISGEGFAYHTAQGAFVATKAMKKGETVTLKAD